MRMSAAENTASKAAVNLASRSNQEPELSGAVAEVHKQIAGLLGYPSPGRAGGDPGEVHATATVLDHHEYVQAAEQDGVDVGEVDRKDPMGRRGEELSPGRAGRLGAGSRPAVVKIRQTVEAATR